MKRIALGGEIPGLPISEGIAVDDFIFCAGQVGDKSNGEIAGSDIESQTSVAIDNLFNLIENAGCQRTNIDSITIFLTDRNNFNGMNKVYTSKIKKPYPARTTVIVAGLVNPKHLIEISAIAHK